MSKYYVEDLLAEQNEKFTAEIAEQMIADARRECADRGMEAMMSVLSAISYLLLEGLPSDSPYFPAPFEQDECC